MLSKLEYCALVVVFGCAGLAAQEQHPGQALSALRPQVASATPLTNNEVISMVRAGQSESFIISQIRAHPVNFDLSAQGQALLRGARVSQNIIAAMTSAMKISPAPQVRPDGGRPGGNGGDVAAGGKAGAFAGPLIKPAAPGMLNGGTKPAAGLTDRQPTSATGNGAFNPGFNPGAGPRRQLIATRPAGGGTLNGGTKAAAAVNDRMPTSAAGDAAFIYPPTVGGRGGNSGVAPQPGPQRSPAISSGGTIGPSHTLSATGNATGPGLLAQPASALLRPSTPASTTLLNGGSKPGPTANAQNSLISGNSVGPAIAVPALIEVRKQGSGTQSQLQAAPALSPEPAIAIPALIEARKEGSGAQSQLQAAPANTTLLNGGPSGSGNKSALVPAVRPSAVTNGTERSDRTLLNGGSKAGPTANATKGSGRTEYEPITVERGVTQDKNFGNWANSPSGSGNKSALLPAVRPSAITNGTKQSAAMTSPAAFQQALRAELAKAPVQGKTITIAKNPGPGSSISPVIATLQNQWKTAEIEERETNFAVRPVRQTVGQQGPSRLMMASTGGGSLQTTGTMAGNTQMRPGTATTASSRTISLARPGVTGIVASLALICAQNPGMRITTVSGTAGPATFTPIDQYDLYTIRGCSFGEQAPTNDQSPTDWVHVYGGTGSFYGKFAIRFWSDNEIDVSLDESISGFPDMDNITLVVKRADGQETQKGGFKFYAARQKVPLKTIPQSWVTLAPFPTPFKDPWSTYYSSAPASPNQYGGSPYPTPSIAPPGPGAGSAYVSRSSNGTKNGFQQGNDYYDFSQLAPGWTTDSFGLTPYDQRCPAGGGWTLTYKQSFGTWSGNWDGNNISVGLSSTSCSGFWAPSLGLNNYQNWSGSYYALTVWVTGPRGTDPLTDKATQ